MYNYIPQSTEIMLWVKHKKFLNTYNMNSVCQISIIFWKPTSNSMKLLENVQFD